MSQVNSSIRVAPAATGVETATHEVGGKHYQALVLADETGFLGERPRYRFISPSSAVGASKVHCDLFNAAGSGKVVKILSVFVYPDIDTAVTGVEAAEVALSRTTAVGTGGTAATNDSASLTAPTISRFDTADAVVPAQITARSAPAGGATAGAYLGSRWVFTEETNAGAAIASAMGSDLIRNEGAKLLLREGEGVRVVQGAVASVGALSVEINFELI